MSNDITKTIDEYKEAIEKARNMSAEYTAELKSVKTELSNIKKDLEDIGVTPETLDGHIEECSSKLSHLNDEMRSFIEEISDIERDSDNDY